jgi:hypothetical protein
VLEFLERGRGNEIIFCVPMQWTPPNGHHSLQIDVKQTRPPLRRGEEMEGGEEKGEREATEREREREKRMGDESRRGLRPVWSTLEMAAHCVPYTAFANTVHSVE